MLHNAFGDVVHQKPLWDAVAVEQKLLAYHFYIIDLNVLIIYAIVVFEIPESETQTVNGTHGWENWSLNHAIMAPTCIKKHLKQENTIRSTMFLSQKNWNN